MESNNEGAGWSTISNDIVLNISSYLGSRDLVSLALTCRRFGIAKDGNEDSLVSKAARDIIKSRWTSDEKDINCVSWRYSVHLSSLTVSSDQMLNISVIPIA